MEGVPSFKEVGIDHILGDLGRQLQQADMLHRVPVVCSHVHFGAGWFSVNGLRQIYLEPRLIAMLAYHHEMEMQLSDVEVAEPSHLVLAEEVFRVYPASSVVLNAIGSRLMPAHLDQEVRNLAVLVW